MLNRFLKFIDSPYHNINQNVSELAHLLIRNIKSQKTLPSKEEIWKLIYNKNSYDDLKFRKLCNDVLERFENFLVLEQLEKSFLLRSNLLLNALKTNNIEELIDKHINKSSRQIEREIDRSSDYFLQKYFYERTIQNLKTSVEKIAKVKSYLNNYNYNALSKNLDIFYTIEKLRHATDILTLRRLYKMHIDTDLGFTKEIIEKYQLNDTPSVHIYSLMFSLFLDEDDEESYFELKKNALNHIDMFPEEERKEIIEVLFNFCVKQINKANILFNTEILELYDWGIYSEIILVNGILSQNTFRNYIASGLRTGEVERVEKFIIEKSDLLEPSLRENAVNFNLARVEFHKKRFDEALKFISKVTYDNIWNQLIYRSQLIAIYYELDEDMVLESQIDSFQVFLRREKTIQDSLRKIYSNFANFVKKICKVNNRDKESITKLRQQIMDETQVINKGWLLEKVDELL